MSSRLTLPLLLIAGSLALWLSHGIGTPVISDDSCQYLDAAANVRAGRGLATTLAHFDEQVSYGRFPVPFTHFAPGYPLLIAAVSLLGMTPEFAAWLISAGAFLACIWLIWDIGIGLGARPGVVALFALLWIAHPAGLTYASMAATEPLFTALLLGMVALIVRDQRTSGTKPKLLFAVGGAAVASYWVRYAGLFLVPVALLYIVWRGLRTRRTLLSAVLACLSSALLAVTIPLRNIHYMGYWQGGFMAGANHSLRTVVAESVKAFYHLSFGDRLATRIDAWTALVFVCLAAATYLAVQTWASRCATVPAHLPAACAWIGLLLAAYTGGIMLAAMVSIAADFGRYYLPIYPVVLVTAAALSPVRNRRQYVAVALLVTTLAVFEVRNLLVPPLPPAKDKLCAILAQESAPDIAIGKWLRTNTGPEDSILSVNGQMLHYLVQRPVISVIEPSFSKRATDEAAFEMLMRVHHVRYLVVMPGASKADVPEQAAIPFLRNLAGGIVPPWLSLAARTPHLVVFECRACIANDSNPAAHN